MTEDLRIPDGTTRLAAVPRWLVLGAATSAVTFALALVSWAALVDPVTNLTGWTVYPEPFTSWLFWCITMIVFVGFNAEFAGFDQLKQPWRGLTLMVVTIASSVAITVGLSHPLASIFPSFSADREAGAGYATGAQWVLFAFLVYVMSVVNWNHWPWTDERVRQPWKGLAEVATLVVPTTILYLIFALPNFLIDGPGSFFGPDATLGFFYCCIVSVILTGNLTENWPWRLAGTPARTAIASVVGNLAVGVTLYGALRLVLPFMIGEGNVDALGVAALSLPAQFGVCWVLWAILWPNAFENYPSSESVAPAKRWGIRLGATCVLAIVTFFGYYFALAGPVLHEPAVGPSMSGNALGFIDWWILWVLWYILCFDSPGLRRSHRGG